MRTGNSRALAALLAGAATCMAPVGASARTEDRYAFDLPAQNLGDALRQVAARAGIELYASTADLEGLDAPALKGDLTARAAILSLLRGSALTAKFDKASVVIRGRISATEAGEGTDAEPIVVTGTHVRGASVASPVITVGRESIEKAGQNDLGEVVRALPQNFNGGQNPGIGTGGGLANGNLNSSSQLNLRGLGVDATLTLLNGHRLPYDGAFAGIDISSIPVAAVERVEIVPDGASAQYGSDVVAGVANIILRRDFDGVTTSARIGAATSGGYFQQGAEAVAGTGWSTGHVMVAYQFAKNGSIRARQRDYAASLPQGNSLYPSVRQHSVLLAARQMLGDGVELKIDGLFSDRHSRTIGGNLSAAGLQRITFAPTATSFSIAPELAIELGGDWMARASLAYGSSKSRYSTLSEPPAGASLLTSGCYCNSAFNAELLFDGPIIALPGGDVRIGFGGGYRTNGMRYSRSRNGVEAGAFDVNRDSHYLFAEANIPIVSPAQQLGLIHRLTVTGAARYENYPGMAHVTTPKLGIVFEPIAGVALRGSWGRSFKAPTLFQQYVGYETYLLPAAAYGAAPSGTIIYTSGGNPSLRPERARSWSAGVEFAPSPSMRFWASYFDVRYRDRVTQPIPGSIASAFSDPGYASLIDRGPSAAFLDDLIEGSLFGLTNFADEPYDPAAVAALVDNRNRNVAGQTIAGIDFGLRYGFAIGADHRLDLTGSATYLKSRQRLTEALPSSQLAGTIFNSPHWRGRVGVSWESPAFTVSAFANYLGKLTDRRFPAVAKLPAALTVDLTAQIAVGAAPDRPSAFDLTLVVNNLLDDRPPLIRTTGSSDTPYDLTNYSPIGRFLGVKVSRKW